MYHLSHQARIRPDAPALIMADGGAITTFAELNSASNRGAQLLRSLGLKRSDRFAIWSGSNQRYLEIAWAMQRSGLYMVMIPARLTVEDAAYIVNDSGASVVIVSVALGEKASIFANQAASDCPAARHIFSLCGEIAGLASWEAATAAMPAKEIADPSFGRPMIYSSGTTGPSKGVFMPLLDDPFDDMTNFLQVHQAKDVTPGSIFATTAPLYHSGPMWMSLSEQAMGATVLLFEKFDPEAVLAAIDRYKVERGQFVPTMFVRMLKLPQEVREHCDVSSIRLIMHAAAPCPVETMRAMIDWWGPVFVDLYSGAEGIGLTIITSAEWLRKPGSVGKSVGGRIIISGEDGNELPPGQEGVVYFETRSEFTYLGDPEKAKRAFHPTIPGAATLGDVGYVDAEGYLFLTDRLSFKINSGGNNIFPQEIEDLLIQHPAVRDAAVFGIPDEDMGELVKAVVESQPGFSPGVRLEAELLEFCRARLAIFKCPRSVDFTEQLPRDPSGKLYKRELRDLYRKERA